MDITKFIKNSKLERSLYEVTGLLFTKKVVLHLGAESKSDPLTIKIEDVEDMFDNLIHELIHILFTQNYNGNFKKKWDVYMKQFEHEPWKTRCHILVHAVHYLVAKELTPDRIKNIKSYSTHKDYTRSWSIVTKSGPSNIVKSFLKGEWH